MEKYFGLLSDTIQAMSRDALTTFYKQLFKFFLQAFDLRRLHESRFSPVELKTLEKAIIMAFLQFVMKLNETIFKPLFLKLVDWATVEIKEDAAGQEARLLFLYQLIDTLLEQLKSIFSPYYRYRSRHVLLLTLCTATYWIMLW
jgi:hypothetical protein